MVHRAGYSTIQLWTRWIGQARTSKEAVASAVAQATNHEGLIIMQSLFKRDLLPDLESLYYIWGYKRELVVLNVVV